MDLQKSMLNSNIIKQENSIQETTRKTIN
jgi:hypothetical protein